MTHIKGTQDGDLHHDDGEHRTTPPTAAGHVIESHERRIRAHQDAHRASAGRCEAYARKGTGYGACDRPLDARGQCDRAGDHT